MITTKKTKILAVNFGGIGDEILFLPTLETIRKLLPDCDLTLLLEPRSRSVEQVTRLLDRVVTFDIKKRPLAVADLMQLVSLLRAGSYDIVISSGSSPQVAVMLFLSGIPIRIGYDSGALSRKMLTAPVKLNRAQYAGGMYHDLTSGLERVLQDELFVRTLPHYQAANSSVSGSRRKPEQKLTEKMKFERTASGTTVKSVHSITTLSMEEEAARLRATAEDGGAQPGSVRGGGTAEENAGSHAANTTNSGSREDGNGGTTSGASNNATSNAGAATPVSTYNTPPEHVPQIDVPTDSMQRMIDFLEEGTLKGANIKRVLLHPGTSRLAIEKGIIKTWDPKYWAELVKKLTGVPDVEVLLAGGPDDEEIIKQIVAQVPNQPNFRNCYGITKSLADLAALTNLSDILVCVDSAPMHIGVGLRKRMVALFAPTDAKHLLPADPKFIALKTATGDEATTPLLSSPGVQLPPSIVFQSVLDQFQAAKAQGSSRA